MTTARPLRVLQSLRPITDADNPYVRQVVAALSPHAEVAFFSWRTALFGDYDVFHVHWPEFLLRAPDRQPWVQRLLFLALLARTALGRRPVVRTLHNLAPHEGATRTERFLLRLLDRRTRVWISLNDAGDERPPQTVRILHGHYRDWFARYPVPESVPGRLLYFGLIRRYKGVGDLLRSFREIDPAREPASTLRIVGKPAEDDLRNEIADAWEADTRISALLTHVDDATLAAEIGQAELVVLPFRSVLNSGSMLLALSLDRPVLVPRGPTTEALAAEVGPGWVYLYEGELDGETLRSALLAARHEPRSPSPDFSRREWRDAGSRHYRAYLAALRGEPLEA